MGLRYVIFMMMMMTDHHIDNIKYIDDIDDIITYFDDIDNINVCISVTFLLNFCEKFSPPELVTTRRRPDVA